MPDVISMIGSSWRFMWKQTSLLHVWLWLITLPMLVIRAMHQGQGMLPDRLAERTDIVLLFSLAEIALYLVMTFATVCVLCVAKRMLQTKAGRARTSLASVRNQAASVFIPYVLTTLLRVAGILLWSILLIVPGIIYALRTSLVPVIIVCEGRMYRDALRRSKEIVHGHLGVTTLTIILVGLVTTVFPFLLAGALDAMGAEFGATTASIAAVLSCMVQSLGVVLYTLSMVQLYAHLEPSAVSTPVIQTLTSR